MINKYIKAVNKSQMGYASFVITLITVIVVSLIVIAFATDSRLEQKDSLSNVLASQAYYAAESGINDAYSIIQQEIADNPTSLPPASTSGSCTPSQYEESNSNSLYGGGDIEYSCLSVDPTPSSLAYQDVLPGEGLVIPVSSTSGNIDTINISWQYYQSTVNGEDLTFGNCPKLNSNAAAVLPTEDTTTPIPNFLTNNCGAPVIQIDMVSNSAIVKNILTQGDTFFLEPVKNTTSAAASSVTPSDYDKVYGVRCSSSQPVNTATYNSPYACTATLNVNNQDSTFYLHLQTFYQPANVYIQADNSSGTSLHLQNAQILIDSTGEAEGQLKRLQERVCYGEYCNNAAPDGAIQSTECIYKKFTVYPGDQATDPAGSC